MKYRVKELKSKPGHFAVFETKTMFLSLTITTDKRAAEIEALHENGRWHQAQIDKIDNKLRKLDALDERDPHGYMC
jgi:hypothetical protein